MPFDDDDEQQALGEKGEYCEVCGAKERLMTLIKCPMCHKYFCEKCQVNFGGKTFCSDFCGQEFFFGGDDDDE
jgi:hypothetical protein